MTVTTRRAEFLLAPDTLSGVCAPFVARLACIPVFIKTVDTQTLTTALELTVVA